MHLWGFAISAIFRDCTCLAIRAYVHCRARKEKKLSSVDAEKNHSYRAKNGLSFSGDAGTVPLNAFCYVY